MDLHILVNVRNIEKKSMYTLPTIIRSSKVIPAWRLRPLNMSVSSSVNLDPNLFIVNENSLSSLFHYQVTLFSDPFLISPSDYVLESVIKTPSQNLNEIFSLNTLTGDQYFQLFNDLHLIAPSRHSTKVSLRIYLELQERFVDLNKYLSYTLTEVNITGHLPIYSVVDNILTFSSTFINDLPSPIYLTLGFEKTFNAGDLEQLAEILIVPEFVPAQTDLILFRNKYYSRQTGEYPKAGEFSFSDVGEAFLWT